MGGGRGVALGTGRLSPDDESGRSIYARARQLRSILAVRDWARRDPAVAERLRRVDNRRMDYLRSLFHASCPDPDDVEARCMVVFSPYIGNHFVVADHGARSRAEVMELTLRWLLDQSSQPAVEPGERRAVRHYFRGLPPPSSVDGSHVPRADLRRYAHERPDRFFAVCSASTDQVVHNLCL